MIRIAFVLCALPLWSFAAPVNSGVVVGKRPGPYSFLVATGPERGKQTCYICEQGVKPAVVIFTRSLNDSVGKFLAKLDPLVIEKKDTGFKVWLTQLTPKADLEDLGKWAKSQGIKNAPVGAFEDVDGPPSYKLHNDAEVTILLFVKEKVVANFAYRPGEFTEKRIPEVMKQLPGLFADKAAKGE